MIYPFVMALLIFSQLTLADQSKMSLRLHVPVEINEKLVEMQNSVEQYCNEKYGEASFTKQNELTVSIVDMDIMSDEEIKNKLNCIRLSLENTFLYYDRATINTKTFDVDPKTGEIALDVNFDGWNNDRVNWICIIKTMLNAQLINNGYPELSCMNAGGRIILGRINNKFPQAIYLKPSQIPLPFTVEHSSVYLNETRIADFTFAPKQNTILCHNCDVYLTIFRLIACSLYLGIIRGREMH